MVLPPAADHHIFDQYGTELFLWSDELCIFLGVDVDTRMTQYDVNHRMTEYLFRHECYLPSERVQMTTDLSTLFPSLGSVTTDVQLKREILLNHLRTHGQVQIAWPLVSSVCNPVQQQSRPVLAE